MPNFDYRAKTSSGVNTDGTIAAASEREAMSLLRNEPVLLVSPRVLLMK